MDRQADALSLKIGDVITVTEPNGRSSHCVVEVIYEEGTLVPNMTPALPPGSRLSQPIM